MKWEKVDFSELPSPSYIIDIDALKADLQTMKNYCDLVGLKPLLAIKGFPLALLFKDIAPFFYGVSASSLFEAKLGRYMEKEIHVHTPAYCIKEIAEVLDMCDHVVVNSFSQWECIKSYLKKAKGKASVGIRINPEFSVVNVEKYNTCLPYSRFGVTASQLIHSDLAGIEGFHLHVMCDHGADTFAKVIQIVIDNFGDCLPRLSWINLGGGQRLADSDYQIELLQKPLSNLISKMGMDVYIEPCEAVITGSGYLVSTVLDIVENRKQTAILDTSALCHMPDVLEMPYRPDIVVPLTRNDGQYSYILAGISCLAGDIIGEYRFDKPLQVGNKVIFSEMGAYTFAKESYFNGINHPSIALYDEKNGIRVVKEFSYKDYEFNYW